MATITKYPNTVANDSNLQDHEQNWTSLNNIKANDNVDANCLIQGYGTISGNRIDDPTTASTSGSGADWYDPGAAADGSTDYYADVYAGGGEWSRYLNLGGMTFNIPSTASTGAVNGVTNVKVEVVCSGQGSARTMEITLLGSGSTSTARTLSMPTSKSTLTFDYSVNSWSMPDTPSVYANLGVRLRIRSMGTNAGVYFVRVTVNYQSKESKRKANGIYATNFGFDFGNNTRINSAKVEWEEYLRNTSGETSSVPAIGGKGVTLLKANNGSNVAKTSSLSVPTGRTQRTMTFSSSDIPNVKRSNIEDSGFGIYLNYNSNSSSNQGRVYLDYVRIVVDYTDPTYSLSSTITSGVIVGNQVTYVLTLKNTNNAHQGVNIPVTVTIPSGLTVASQSGNGTYNTGTKKWNAVLDSTRTAKLTLVLNSTSAGTKTINASVDGFSTTLNKSTTIQAPTYTVTSPKVNEVVTETQNLTYTVTVGVNTTAASSVNVSVPIPENMSFISASGAGTYNSGTGVWNATFTNRTATMTFTWRANTAGVKSQTISVGTASFTKQITILPVNVTVPYYTDHALPEEVLRYMIDGEVYTFSCWSVVTDTVFNYVYAGDKNFAVSIINGDQEYLSDKATELNVPTRISTNFIYNSNQPIKLRIYGQWLEVNPQNARHEVGGFALYHIKDDRENLLSDNNIYDNIASGTDYLGDTTGTLSYSGATIESNTEWASEGERSFKINFPGSSVNERVDLLGIPYSLPVAPGETRTVSFDVKGRHDPVPNMAPPNCATATNLLSSVDGFIPRSATLYTSTEQAKIGTRSLKTVPTGATNDSGTSLVGDTGGLRLGLQPGHTYTVGAWVYLTQAAIDDPEKGTIGRIIIFDRTTAYESSNSGVTPLVTGWQWVQVTRTIREDATEAFIRLQNGCKSTNAVVYWGGVIVVEDTEIPSGSINLTTGTIEETFRLKVIERNSASIAISEGYLDVTLSETPNRVILPWIFTNPNTVKFQFYIINNTGSPAEFYVDKIKVYEFNPLENILKKTDYELPALLFDNLDALILDGDYAEVTLEPLRTGGVTSFLNFNWSGFEEDEEIIIKGIEVKGDIDIEEDIIINTTLFHADEQVSHSVVVPYTNEAFSIGGERDKWGLNQINLPNLSFSFSLTNTTTSTLPVRIKNISIVIYYIYDETCGNYGYTLDGVHSREYNVFLVEGWEKPDGLNNELEGFKLIRSDGEKITSSTVGSKEFKIKFQIVADTIEDANEKLKEITGWMTNSRDERQKPITKAMIFDWDKGREYNVILKDAIDVDSTIGNFECTANFLIPEGVGWTSTKTTGSAGRNDGLIPVRPLIQVLCTGANQLVLYESISGQNLTINFWFAEGTVLTIDTKNRIVTDSDGFIYIQFISIDSYWFKIREKTNYSFTTVGCTIQKIEYKEAV